MATQAVTGTNSAANSTTAPSSQATGYSETDFLKLLVTQLQNQDPLNPTDPDQFMSELCQMTQVESLQNIETSLNNMSSATQMGQWVSTIGHKMAVNSSSLSEGDEVVLAPKGSWDTITLSLKNSDGTTSTQTFKSGDSLVYTDSTGSQTVTGATATYNGQTSTCPAQVYRVIAGVQTGSSGTELVAQDGTTYATSSITQITD
jgi:flagellar basal-body rod modification protein FlgD